MTWFLLDPEGKTYEVEDIKKWAEENVSLFFPEDPPQNASARIHEGFQALAYAVRHPKRKGTLKTYKGWTLPRAPQKIKPQALKKVEKKQPKSYADSLIGQTYGYVTAVGVAPSKIDANGSSHIMLLVHCSLCDNYRIMSYDSLKQSKSCGCLRGKKRKDREIVSHNKKSEQNPYKKILDAYKRPPIKKFCVICGKEFYVYLSNAFQKCCSKKCGAALRMQNGYVNNAKWSDEAKQRRANNPAVIEQVKGFQKAGAQAALMLPEGQRGPQNRAALVWILIDPSGNYHKVVNLYDWSRKNKDIFFSEDVDEDTAAMRISSGFKAIASSMRGVRSRSRPVQSYKGWRLAELPYPKKPEDYKTEEKTDEKSD